METIEEVESLGIELNNARKAAHRVRHKEIEGLRVDSIEYARYLTNTITEYKNLLLTWVNNLDKADDNKEEFLFDMEQLNFRHTFYGSFWLGRITMGSNLGDNELLETEEVKYIIKSLQEMEEYYNIIKDKYPEIKELVELDYCK